MFEKLSRTDDLVTAIEDTLLTNDIYKIKIGNKGEMDAKEIFIRSKTVKVIQGIRNIPIIAVPTLPITIKVLN